jgi:hypothetical protein
LLLTDPFDPFVITNLENIRTLRWSMLRLKNSATVKNPKHKKKKRTRAGAIVSDELIARIKAGTWRIDLRCQDTDLLSNHLPGWWMQMGIIAGDAAHVSTDAADYKGRKRCWRSIRNIR